MDAPHVRSPLGARRFCWRTPSWGCDRDCQSCRACGPLVKHLGPFQSAHNQLAEAEADIRHLEAFADAGPPDQKRVALVDHLLEKTSVALDGIEIGDDLELRRVRRAELDRCDKLEKRIAALKSASSAPAAADKESEKQKPQESVIQGLRPGDRVKSLTSGNNWNPRALKFGDVGTVLAAKEASGLVRVEFDGEPKMVGPVYENQLEKLDEDYLKPGDRVSSFVEAPHWNPRPLSVGDKGTVLASKDVKNLVKVKWDGNPKMVGTLYENQLLKIQNRE